MPELFVGTNAKLFQRRCKTKQRGTQIQQIRQQFSYRPTEAATLPTRVRPKTTKRNSPHDEPFPAHSATDRCRINATNRGPHSQEIELLSLHKQTAPKFGLVHSTFRSLEHDRGLAVRTSDTTPKVHQRTVFFLRTNEWLCQRTSL